jgi:hypothetical protein
VSVAYEAVLDVSEDSVLFLSGLLRQERARRGTRKGTRGAVSSGHGDSDIRLDLGPSRVPTSGLIRGR